MRESAGMGLLGTALEEHARDVRWCSRHKPNFPYRPYRRGRRRCLKCGYFLPLAGSRVFSALLAKWYAPGLRRQLAETTTLWDLLTRDAPGALSDVLEREGRSRGGP